MLMLPLVWIITHQLVNYSHRPVDEIVTKWIGTECWKGLCHNIFSLWVFNILSTPLGPLRHALKMFQIGLPIFGQSQRGFSSNFDNFIRKFLQSFLPYVWIYLMPKYTVYVVFYVDHYSKSLEIYFIQAVRMAICSVTMPDQRHVIIWISRHCPFCRQGAPWTKKYLYNNSRFLMCKQQ
jgi:hypothetical protein